MPVRGRPRADHVDRSTAFAPPGDIRNSRAGPARRADRPGRQVQTRMPVVPRLMCMAEEKTLMAGQGMESSLTIDQLRERLSRHLAHHVCNQNTRLVVEGYPRSGNSFTVDMLAVCGGSRLRREEMAHHTHEIENLLLADACGIPKMILIREPEDAILSYMIFSGRPVAACAERYARFYRCARNLLSNAIIVHFRDAIADFRTVACRLNALGNYGIPQDQDFSLRHQEALALLRGRASDDPERAARQVAAPSEKREEMKKAARANVLDYLERNGEARRAYEEFLGN